MEWKRLSSSINYFINTGLWGEDLLESNDELLERYISLALDLEDGVYYYMDKKTYELIPLSDEEIERVKITFLERIEKKKLKYADEIDEIRSKKIFREDREYLTEELEESNKLEEFKVIEFPERE